MSASPSELASAEPDTTISVASARVEGRGLPRLAALLAAVAVVEAVSLVLFKLIPYSPLPIGLDSITIGFLASVVLFPLVGALIIGRRPRTRVAWVMVFTGLALGTALFTYAYGIVGMLVLRPPGALAMEMLVVSQVFFVPAIGLGTTILILLFPTDRLLGPRWRLAIAIGVVGLAMYSIGTMFRADQLDAELLPGLVNPLSRAAPALAAAGPTLILIGNILMVSMILPAAASMVLRYRRADPVVAAQIRWFAVFAGLAAICLSASAFDFGPLSDLAFQVGIVLLACVPVAIGIAITRYRLYDIDRLINRTLVYGSLTAILAGVFTAGVGLAQRLFVAFTGQSSDAAIVLATLVVATFYAPLRKWLEGHIDKRFKYEQRRFGSYTDRVRSVLVVIDPVRAAENLARETISELDAIGVAVVDADGSVVATAGLWPPAPGLPVTEIQLSDNSHLFAVRLGPRRSGVGYRAEELALLAEAGRLTAAAVRPG